MERFWRQLWRTRLSGPLQQGEEQDLLLLFGRDPPGDHLHRGAETVDTLGQVLGDIIPLAALKW